MHFHLIGLALDYRIRNWISVGLSGFLIGWMGTDPYPTPSRPTSSLLVNTWADATGRRLPAAMFNLALQLFGTACLVVWKIPLGMHVIA
jgi:hypothetical protein